ncbi:unnamed protein product [Acanthoscelides obtectus]|uniref:Protein LLP homolog n=1 Tax=Acanthoscelides obtectus TaxID=200917 RepID=A0A9P0KMR8_ACAOB|nr:unnamed protein product [Acanthoscelides obtectus]CAK1640087.1 Protein LLP homolog [Acanthoscelides obtectus]
MAKSIRSKWKRKCRAIKRERYGKKELERLKKTLGIKDESGISKDIAMKDCEQIITFTTAEEINKKQEEPKDIMDVSELDDLKKKFNPKTLRNESGAYPVWVHPRKIKKGKGKKQKSKKNKGNVGKRKNKS